MTKNNLEDSRDRKRQTRDEQLGKGKDRDKLGINSWARAKTETN